MSVPEFAKLSAAALAALLDEAAQGGAAPLLLDTRAPTAFAANHIAGAVSLSLPKLLLKRIQKLPLDALRLEDLVVCDKEQLQRRASGCAVVVYDETGALDDVSASTVLAVLAGEGVPAACIDGALRACGATSPLTVRAGGFAALSALRPDLCTPSRATLAAAVPAPDTPGGIGRQTSHNPLEAPASTILPFLVMGNEREAQNPDFIKQHGITHVLNLTLLPSIPEVAALATCLQIPLTDTTDQDISACLDDAIAFIDAARDSGGRVLVHCFAGVSRTAAITIAYFLFAFEHMTLDDAYKAVRAKRPVISPNLNFMGQLQRFEESLRARRRTLPQPQ